MMSSTLDDDDDDVGAHVCLPVHLCARGAALGADADGARAPPAPPRQAVAGTVGRRQVRLPVSAHLMILRLLVNQL